jgi:hypothetical protein
VPHGVPFDDDVKAEARRLWAEGKLNDSQIATSVGISAPHGRSTIMLWRKNAEPDGTSWAEFRQQARNLALERAREELSDRLAPQIIADVETLHGLARNITGLLVYEINEKVVRPMNEGRPPWPSPGRRGRWTPSRSARSRTGSPGRC